MVSILTPHSTMMNGHDKKIKFPPLKIPLKSLSMIAVKKKQELYIIHKWQILSMNLSTCKMIYIYMSTELQIMDMHNFI